MTEYHERWKARRQPAEQEQRRAQLLMWKMIVRFMLFVVRCLHRIVKEPDGELEIDLIKLLNSLEKD